MSKQILSSDEVLYKKESLSLC